MKGQRSGGTTTLDIDHGHALGEQARFHHGGETHLSTDTALPPLPHAAVAKPGLLNQMGIRNGQARVLHRVGVSPLRQVGKGAVSVFAKRRATRANHIDIGHGSGLAGGVRAHQEKIEFMSKLALCLR